MPEDNEQDMMAGAQTPAETNKQRFERERLTRRQALRKFGITAGVATFAMFSVDDLARMVGNAMQQRVGDNKIAGQIAQEFQQAGVAFASVSPSLCTACVQHWQDCLSCKCNAGPSRTYTQYVNNQGAALNRCGSNHCPSGVYAGPIPPAKSCNLVDIRYCA